MSTKIHIFVALVAAMGAVLILSLLVIAQGAHDSAGSLSTYRQGSAFLDVNPDTLRVDPKATM